MTTYPNHWTAVAQERLQGWLVIATKRVDGGVVVLERIRI
jgi:hypothetical protein